jgi:hypothetical protein
MCTVFSRSAQENRTPIEIKERSAEGKNADCVSPERSFSPCGAKNDLRKKESTLLPQAKDTFAKVL